MKSLILMFLVYSSAAFSSYNWCTPYPTNNEITNCSIVDAIYNNDTKLVKKLLKLGARANDWAYGITPLMAAADKGNYEAMKAIVSNGADVNARTFQKNGYTALYNIASTSHRIYHLEEEIPPKFQVEMIRLLVENGANLDYQYSLVLPLLIDNIEFENSKIAKLLIELGASVEISDEYGDTPLIYAQKKGYLEIEKLIRIILGTSKKKSL